MAYTHSKHSRLLLGTFHYSGYIKDIDSSRSMEPADTTVLTDTAKTSIPGLVSGTLSIGGYFDATPSTQDARLEATIQSANGETCTYGPEGFALGKSVQCLVTRTTNYALGSKNTAAVDWKADLVSDGILDRGVSLADYQSISADASHTSVDNSASSASGGAGYLHIDSLTGLTNIVVKVQHSTDNSSWADLVTFATATGATHERVVVAGTVNRYLRADFDVTGSGQATCQVSFCRR